MPKDSTVSFPLVLGQIAALTWLMLVSSARADEFYYVALLSAQRIPNDPDHSHTFAAFVRAYGDDPCSPDLVVEESFCISWLPETNVVHTDSWTAETGANFRLLETVDHALCEGERVSCWGPYRIDERLYDGACRQFCLLKSGVVRYKAVDSGFSTAKISNCIHAVSSAADGNCPRILSPGWGDLATWIVAQRFRPGIVNPHETHEWVYSYLGLDDFPIVRREFDQNPQTGTYQGAIKILADILP